jgi:putative (di)nucleoside polyphosphate hydrolase
MRWPPRLNRPYRPCVGIMLINEDNQVFVAQRLDHPSNAWQMPQGGIDPGEDPKVAAFRELKEEIGTNQASVIAVASRQYKYDIPQTLNKRLWQGRYKGQTQLWFLMRFEGKDEDINLDTDHPEFSAWRWAPMDELLDLIVHFKREVYVQVLKEFEHYLK